jgi:hypothetical protein
MRQTYRQEEAEQILRDALQRASQEGSQAVEGTGEVPHERLLAMAEELGIEPSALEAVLRDRESRRLSQTLQGERRAFLAHRRAQFWPHLSSYLAVNAFLIAINLLTSRGHFWAIWPLLGWGLGLFFHARSALATGGEEFEREFAAWRAERELAER